VKRIVLHAGLPKTGTTSIQEFLARETEALAAHGILFPVPRADLRELGRAQGIGIGWHSALTRLVSQKPGALAPGEWEAWTDEFARFAADPSLHTLMLSQEGMLLNRKASGVRLLVDALPAGQRDVVLVLRPALGWLTSLWEQLVRGGDPVCPADFSRAHAYLNGGFARSIQTILQQVPDARLRLFSFETLAAGDGLLVNFARAIGLPEDLIARAAVAPRVNAGLPQDMVAALLACNRAGIDQPAFVAIRGALARAARRRKGRLPRASIFPEALTRAILDRYEADRRILGDRFGIDLRAEAPPPGDALALTPDDWKRLRAEAAPFLSATAQAAWDRVPS
jgi:hypothetical protein